MTKSNAREQIADIISKNAWNLIHHEYRLEAADAIFAAFPSILEGMIKPLEWEYNDGNYPKWVTPYLPVWGGMFQAKIDKSEAACFGRFPLFIDGLWDEKKHQTLKSAMASAQNKYDARCQRPATILSAIGVGTP